MPWAWFIPALTQLSLCLPLFVATYKFCLPNRNLCRILFTAGMVVFCALSGILTLVYDVGAMPV